MAEGLVSLSGTSTQNQTLVANVLDSDGVPTQALISYQWQQSSDSGNTWFAIADATAPSLTLTQDNVGRRVRAIAAYTDALGNTEVVNSAASAAIANVNDLGLSQIVGTPVQGQTLRASAIDLDGLPGTVSFAWQQLIGSSWSNISGATGQSYTLQAAQVGRQIRIRISYTDLAGAAETNRTSSATPAIIAANPAGNDVGVVSISGTATQFQTLAASVSDVDGLPAGTAIAYQWQQSADDGATWSNIAGATTSSLTLQQAQVGKRVRSAATYTDTLGGSGTVFSAPTAAIANVAETGQVLISGAAVQGKVLSATIIDPDGLGTGTITYSWQQLIGASWSTISGATGQTLTLQAAQIGRQIRARATYTDALGAAESNRTSIATSAVISAANRAGSAIVAGTPTQGQILTASVSDTDGVPGSISYQWQQSSNGTTWSNIGGATANTLTLQQAQVGNFVRATASYIDLLGNSESVTSPPTATTIANINDPGSITISGTAAQGQTLTAAVSDPDGVPAGVVYQWQSSDDGQTWSNLTTGQSLVLTSAQVGKRIRVTTSYNDQLGTSEAPVSAATAPVAAQTATPVSVFTTQTPAQPNFTDGPNVDYELGMRFVSSNAGLIQAIRYYKPSSETGTHVGRIWTSTGQLLATVTFTNETGSGWQQQTLATALAVNAGATYVVSVNANSYYALTSNGFANPISNGGLTAPTSAGVFNYTPATFPSTVYQNENYFRDVVFATGANPNNRPGLVSVAGTSTQGQILTASVSDADGVPGSVSYQWQQSSNGTTWSNIGGATASTLTLQQAQVGNFVRATASYIDLLGNSESVTSPPTATTIANINDPGSITISGTAAQGQTLTAAVSDPDGVPAGVVYQWQSSDDGQTWSNLTTGQSLVLTSAQVGKRIRVTTSYNDQLGTSEAPVSAATAPVAAQTATPVSVFTTQTPAQPNFTDGPNVDYELGMRFVSSNAGLIQAIRYYKPSSETGTHVGRIWTSTGQLLATVTFTNETGSGWQQQTLATALAVNAGATYVVSVNANSYYALTSNGFANPISNGGLTAPTSAGVFNYTPATFPSTVYQNENYFRDVVFATGANPNNRPGLVSVAGTSTQGQILTASVSDADGVPGSVSYQWQQSSNGTTWSNIGGATASTLTLQQAQVGNFVRATASYIDLLGNSENVTSSPTATTIANINDPGSITISGTAAQGQTLTAAVSDPDGVPAGVVYQWQSSDDGQTWSNLTTGQSLVLTSAQVGKRIRAIANYNDQLGTSEAPVSAATAPVAAQTATPVSVFTTQTPAQPNFTDGPNVDYELGMRFVSDNAGLIQAIRYYKPSSETGTHVGRIWTSTGQLLATVTFTNETGSGWQQQTLATALAVNAGSTYVVSVNANSYYALTSNGFASPISNGGLVAPASAGVFNYTPAAFPNTVYQNENYFRDVVFTVGSNLALQSNATVFVSETAGFATITVVRSGGTIGTATLEYSVSQIGGSNAAQAGVDYTSPTFEGRANTGQIVFADGASTATITIPIIDDQNAEGNEAFSVGIQNPSSGVSLGVPRTVLVSIIDDDSPAEISFATPVVTLSEGAALATLTLQRTGSLQSSASVVFTTINGTASAGLDYTSFTDTATFVAGQATKTVSIPILNDSTSEGDEFFSVNLSSPTGAALGSQASARVNILDNDGSLGNLTRQTVVSGLSLPTGIDWTSDGRYMLIAQQNGIVRVVDNGVLRAAPLVDLSSQVNTVGDRGLLGMALDPNFATNPYVYLLYTYDPPETAGRTGLAGPDGGGNRPARLVRMTVNPTTMVANPASMVVLAGTNSTWAFTSRPDSDSTGNVSIAPSGIVNGSTITAPANLVETGTQDNDPSTAGIQNQNIRDYIATDSDSHTIGAVHFGPDGYLYLSVGDGTSYNFVDPRAVRVQDIHNLSGKLLRIDPVTGAGVAGNPYFDPADPFSNASKVFYSGIRNAYRFTFDPATGLPVIGDVGWTTWEEINTGPAGSNFGWPYLEGPGRTGGYQDLGQAVSFYNNGNRNNPGDTPAVFPLISRSHGAPDSAAAITVGDFFNNDTMFFNDVLNGNIYTATLNASRQISNVQVFDTGVPYIVDMQKGPDGWLYGVDLGTGTIRRWIDTGSSAATHTLMTPT